MKKLLHLQLLPLLSGVQNFSLHLLDGLPKDEFEIWVACKPGGEFVDAVGARGYKYVPVHSLRHPISLWDVLAFFEIWWIMLRHRFDIVHTHSSKTGLLGRLAATLCKVPLIVHTVHGTAFQEGQSAFQQRLYKLLERWGNGLCHQVVFVNQSDRLICVTQGLVPEDKALTIYNALPERKTRNLTQIAIRRMFDEHKPDFVIGSTLRFSRQKNVVNIVSTACRACKQDSRLRFILVGEGEYLSLCKQIVHSHGLNERILLPGWDLQVGKWLEVFDAFILYSRWEAQPFSIIEAMHAGLPVIGSRIPSIGELVDETSGYLVTLDDHKALIECMLRLAEHPQEAFEKGQQAQKRIRELCSYQQMVEGYLKVYRNDSARGETGA